MIKSRLVILFSEIIMAVLMVRSNLSVLKQGYVGYGWSREDFSQFTKVSQLLTALKKSYPKGLGRGKNNIKRFFNLKKGDIVVVPAHKSIILGIVTGQKHYDKTLAKQNASNLVAVEFLMQGDSFLRVPRKELTQQLESRLKIRSGIADLVSFEAEVKHIIDKCKTSDEVYKQSSYFEEQREEVIDIFKMDLFASIKNGTTWLAAGGYGIERIIKELLEIDGYTADIKAKNQTSGIADIDIEAVKVDRFSETYLLIQAKHHKGITSKHGIKQLLHYQVPDDGKNYQKWLITTAELSDEAKEFASEENINYMEGFEFISWIYENIAKLSNQSKRQLGIFEVPSLLKKIK